MFAMIAIALLAICSLAVVAADSDESDATGTVYDIKYYTGDDTCINVSTTWGMTSVDTSASIGGAFSGYYYTKVIDWVALSTSAYPTASGSSTASGLTATGSVTNNGNWAVGIGISGTATASNTWYATMSVTYTKTSDSTTTTVMYGATLTVVQSQYASLQYNSNNAIVYVATSTTTGTTGSYTFTINYTPTYTNHTLLGWATSYGSTTVSYAIGSTIGVAYGGSATLYAVWETTAYVHSLVYNANGGSGAPTTQSTTDTNETLSMTISSSVLTRDGYTFLGWAVTSYAINSSYAAGSTISVGETITLYAVWSAVGSTYTHTLNYSANGGIGAPQINAMIDSNPTLSMTVGIKIPTRSGYTFLGWGTLSTDMEASYQAGDQITVANGTIMLYAVWEQITSPSVPIASFTYTVRNSTVTFSDHSVGAVVWQWNFGDTVTSTSQNPIHTYEEEGSYTVTLVITNATLTSLCSHIVTVGASSTTTYTITFDYGDGIGTPETISGKGLSYITLPNSTLEGYTLEGWYYDEVFIGNPGSEYQINGSVTLIAIYQEGTIECFTVTFTDGTITKTQTVISGGIVTYVRPVNDGDSFLGWYTEDNEKYVFGTTVIEDLTLTATYSDSEESFDYTTIIIVIVIVMIAIGGLIAWKH